MPNNRVCRALRGNQVSICGFDCQVSTKLLAVFSCITLVSACSPPAMTHHQLYNQQRSQHIICNFPCDYTGLLLLLTSGLSESRCFRVSGGLRDFGHRHSQMVFFLFTSVLLANMCAYSVRELRTTKTSSERKKSFIIPNFISYKY